MRDWSQSRAKNCYRVGLRGKNFHQKQPATLSAVPCRVSFSLPYFPRSNSNGLIGLKGKRALFEQEAVALNSLNNPSYGRLDCAGPKLFKYQRTAIQRGWRCYYTICCMDEERRSHYTRGILRQPCSTRRAPCSFFISASATSSSLT